MKKILLIALLLNTFSFAQAFKLEGIIVNVNSKAPVSDAAVLLMSNGKVATITQSNFNGEFSINIKKGRSYTLEVAKDGYKTETADFIVSEEFINSSPYVNVELKPLNLQPDLSEMQSGMNEKELNPDIMEDVGEISELPEGYKIIEAKPLQYQNNNQSGFNVNLNKKVPKTNVNVDVLKETFNKESLESNLNSETEKFPSSFYAEGSVFYGAGKAMLTPSVKEILNGIIVKLKNEPTASLKIVAYADSQREAEIGDYIGKLRVEEITNYFTKNAIPFEQLMVSVVGNKAALNGCLEGVECDEFQHQENRRVDLIFIQ